MDGQAKVQLILELKNRITTSLTKAKESVNSNVSAMKSKLAELKVHHTQAFQAMADQVPGLGSAMTMLANPYAIATAAAVAFGAAGVKAAQWSNNWATKMAEVNVTAGLTKKELAGLSDKLVDIGARNVAPLESIPDAFNRIISSGLDLNTSLKVLEPTLRAAKAGFMMDDIATVAAAGVGVMAASGEDINKVYDILFATLNKGNAKFNDIARYLPKIVPLARGAGFALAETAGAWAYLTAQGQTAEQATTGIMNAVKAFSNVDISAKLKPLGVEVYDQSGKIKPMLDIVQQLSTKMGGLSDQQKAMMLDKVGIIDMEAKGAILAMIQNVGKLKETTDAVVNSQGALNKAYDDSLTPMDNWKIVVNQFKATVWKPFGDAILTVFSKAGFYVLNLIQYFKNLWESSVLLRDIFSVLGTAIKWAFKIVIIPIKQVWNLIVGLYDKIKFVINAFSDSKLGQGLSNFYNKIRPYFIWIKETVGQVADILYKLITLDFSGAWDAVKAFKMPEIDEIRNRKQVVDAVVGKEENPLAPGTELSRESGSETATSGSENEIDKITGSAKQIRNITVNIDSFVKGGIQSQNTQINQMNASQLEEWFNNMMLRVIRNVELKY